ncbi:hypothetical protein [Kingella oralis]
MAKISGSLKSIKLNKHPQKTMQSTVSRETIIPPRRKHPNILLAK